MQSDIRLPRGLEALQAWPQFVVSDGSKAVVDEDGSLGDPFDPKTHRSLEDAVCSAKKMDLPIAFVLTRADPFSALVARPAPGMSHLSRRISEKSYSAIGIYSAVREPTGEIVFVATKKVPNAQLTATGNDAARIYTEDFLIDIPLDGLRRSC